MLGTSIRPHFLKIINRDSDITSSLPWDLIHLVQIAWTALKQPDAPLLTTCPDNESTSPLSFLSFAFPFTLSWHSGLHSHTYTWWQSCCELAPLCRQRTRGLARALHVCKSLQLSPTLCDPMDCSLPGSSVHGIFLARILEWVAMPSSRGSSQPRDQSCVSYVPCIGRWVLYHYHHLGSQARALAHPKFKGNMFREKFMSNFQ